MLLLADVFKRMGFDKVERLDKEEKLRRVMADCLRQGQKLKPRTVDHFLIDLLMSRPWMMWPVLTDKHKWYKAVAEDSSTCNPQIDAAYNGYVEVPHARVPGIDKVAWLTMAADPNCQKVLEHFGCKDGELRPKVDHVNGAVITMEGGPTQ